MRSGGTSGRRAVDARLDRVPLTRLVRRWWFVVIVAGVVGGLAGAVVASSIDPSYEARTQILVGPMVPDADVLEGASDLARTYGELLESRTFVEEAGRRAGVASAGIDVVATSQRASAVLDLQVRAPTADGARAVSAALISELREIIDRSSVPIDVDALDPATAGVADLVRTGELITELGTAEPTAGRRTIPSSAGLVAGGFAGAMLGLSFALTVERRSRRPRLAAEGLGVDVRELPAIDVRWRRLARAPAVVDRPGPLLDRMVRHPDRPTRILVTSTGDQPGYVDGVLQLAAGLRSDVWIVDAHGVIGDRLVETAGAPTEEPRVYTAGATSLRISPPLVGPEGRPVDWFEDDADLGASVPAFVVAYAPTTEHGVVWPRGASAADLAVFLTLGHAGPSDIQRMLRYAASTGDAPWFHLPVRRHLFRRDGTAVTARDARGASLPSAPDQPMEVS